MLKDEDERMTNFEVDHEELKQRHEETKDLPLMEQVDTNLDQRLQAYITQLNLKKFNEQKMEPQSETS